MDELKEVWKQLKAKTNNLTDFSSEEIAYSINQKSKGLMETIRRKVKIKFYFCVGATALVGGFLPFAYPLPSQILLLIMFGAYLVADILLWKEYKSLSEYTDATQPVVDTLRQFQKKVKQILHYEELIGLMLYPISATAGFMIGLAEGSENGEFMTDRADWIALVLVLIILVPACDWFAKWMNRVTFGSYLKKLEVNISEMENEKTN